MDERSITREIQVFCDASEQAYGAVTYLRTVDKVSLISPLLWSV